MKRRKNEIREELENLAPFLSKLKEKKEGFEVPKDYFKTLPNQVFEKLGNEPSPLYTPQKSSSGFWSNPFQLFFKPKYALALATISLLLIASIFWFKNAPEPEQFADLTIEEIQNYVVNNIDEFEEDLFLEGNLSFENLESKEGIKTDEMLDDLIKDLDIEDLEELL